MRNTPAVLLFSTLLNVTFVVAFAVRPSLAPAVFREMFHFGDRAAHLAAPPVSTAPSLAKPTKLWPTVATENLTMLAERLRALGFPAAVIREILTAEVQARYDERLRALIEPDPDTPFWKIRPSPLFTVGSPRATEYARLQRERARILRELFSDPFFASEDVSALQRRQFGDLPRQKIDLLQRIEDDYAEMTSAIRAGTNGVMLPEDREKLALLAREKRTDLAGVLTAEELTDYTFRSSPITQLLSSQLGEFHASEAEYRAIFGMQQAMNDKFPTNPGNGLSKYTERRAAQQELEVQLRAQLGEARYTDYLRETSEEFRQARRLAQRENLPAEVATRAFDLRNGVAVESIRIVDDPALTNEQKRAAMVALAQNTRTQVIALLGPSAGPTFVKTLDNAWLNNIENGSAMAFTGGPNSSFSNNDVTVAVGSSARPVRSVPPANLPRGK